MSENLTSVDGICWSPNSELLCIWCSSSGEPKLMIYSAISEKHIVTYQPQTNIEYLNSIHESLTELKGIDNVKWSPSAQFLAITGYNEVVTLLNNITWKPLLSLYLDPVIRENNFLNKVYLEKTVNTNTSNGINVIYNKHVLEEEHDRPISIRIGRKNQIDVLSVATTDILEFSPCGRYIALRHEIYPTTLWIWDIVMNSVDYILLESPIVGVTWNPTRIHLLIFCKCTYFFEWTPNKAKCVTSPRNIIVLQGQWHKEGEMIALSGYGKSVIHRITD
ncbi:WD repeat-containing protein WRAP73-like isoform X2 [Prorops nasuta]